MIYGYIRVSSDKQTVENQRFEITNFCQKQNLYIDDWIEETISGTKAYNKRELGRLLRKVSKGDIWTIKDNYRLGDDIQSKVLAFAFGLSAEIERNLISQRTKEALARKRAEGVTLGRPQGAKTAPEKHKLYTKQTLIAELLKQGVSQRRIAKILQVDRGTLSRFIQFRKELRELIS